MTHQVKAVHAKKNKFIVRAQIEVRIC